jgi:hypothetical protein
VEIQTFWDSQPGGNVRVMGSIDDGGWGFPSAQSFVHQISS